MEGNLSIYVNLLTDCIFSLPGAYRQALRNNIAVGGFVLHCSGQSAHKETEDVAYY